MILEKRKVKNSLRKLYTCGVFCVSVLVISGGAIAGQVTQFGQWTVNNGTIDTDLSCQDVNIVCTVLMQGSGFRQELVDAGNTGSYIRTIITDDSATGSSGSLPFEQETFIPFNGNGAAPASFGLALSSAVRDSAQGFDNIAVIHQDPFVDVNSNQLLFSTVNLTATMNTPEIISNFNYASNALTGYPDPANDIFGKMLDIDVDVIMDCNGTTGQMTGGGMMGCSGGMMGNFMAQQRFVQRDRQGWNIDITTGNLIVSPITAAGSLALDPSVLTVAWNEGDNISTTWIAQADNQGNMFSFDVNYQSVSNLDSGDTQSFSNNNQGGFAAFTVTPPLDPFAWDPVFGPAPPSLNTPQ